MPFKDNDYVPKLWDYDITHQAVVLSQKEIKALRDKLNEEYLRRWSGYINHESSDKLYMDYTSRSTQFTDSDGKHIHRLPSWNGRLAEPTKSTSDDPQYRMADGNISNSYWDRNTSKDFRGCPVWYSPLDRYVDGNVNYNRTSNQAPTVTSKYKGPDAGKTFPLGTSEWRNAEKYTPHGVNDVTKDRSFKHLIDGLVNMVDLDKYYGTGIHNGDPVVPYNRVNYGNNQDPKNSERVSHAFRQMGLVTNTNTPGNPATTAKSGTIKDWIDILKKEQRNEYYIRACNYHHWIWYFTDFRYNTEWDYSCKGKLTATMPQENSYKYPTIKDDSARPEYDESHFKTGKLRNNYNPAYYGHRESYTSCQIACTGYCSQTCFHVCDEQCVYLCDDKCGYTCMNGAYDACGTVCIANCRDCCGGDILQEGGGGGGNPCQFSCNTGSNYTAGNCSLQCASSCEGFVKDEQACSDCVGYCSNDCTTICMGGCKFNCSTNTCMISCQDACVEDGPGKGGCAVSTCNQGCDDSCDEECADEADGGDDDRRRSGRSRRSVSYTPKEVNVTIGEEKNNAQDASGI